LNGFWFRRLRQIVGLWFGLQWIAHIQTFFDVISVAEEPPLTKWLLQLERFHFRKSSRQRGSRPRGI
jgi:hypothetical protein